MIYTGVGIGAGLLGALVGAGIGMAVSYYATGIVTANVRWMSAFNKALKGDYSKILRLSTHNSKSNYVSLGRYYNKKSPKNYINIAKKNNFTYFNMGNYYKGASKKKIAQEINELFLKEQHSLGKIFYKISLDIGGAYETELSILKEIGAITLPF